MRVGDAFFVYFSFLWYCLPRVVSHTAVRMIFFLNVTFLFARSWHFYTACFIADPTLFSPAMPPFCFPTKPQLYALAAEVQHSAPQCIRYLMWPSGRCCYTPHPLHMVLPPNCSLFISPQAFWLGWRASTMKINGFALCLWWLVDFFGTAPSFVGKPGVWQPPLSFRNLKSDQHIWGISLKRKKRACSSAFQPLTRSNYSIADMDRILYFRKVHMPCSKHGMSNCSSEMVS